MTRIIHTEDFAKLSLIDKLYHCTASDIILSIMSPTAIGYDPLGVGQFRKISSEDRAHLYKALHYSLERQRRRVERSMSDFHQVLVERFAAGEIPVASEAVEIPSGIDKLHFITPDELTPQAIDEYWPADRFPGVADAVRRVQRVRRDEIGGPDATVEDAKEHHLYNIRLNMSGIAYKVDGQPARMTPAYQMVRTKFFPYNKAMRDFNREIALDGKPKTTEEKQRVFDAVTLKDIVAGSFVFAGPESEAQDRARQAIRAIAAGTPAYTEFLGTVKDDYKNPTAQLRRAKINFIPWRLPEEDRRSFDIAELQVNDIVNLIGIQELGLLRHDTYMDERNQKFMYRGTEHKYSENQVKLNESAQEFKLLS